MKINQRRNTAIFILLIHIIGYYLWLIIFNDHHILLNLGGNTFQMIAPLIAFFWLFRESGNFKGKDQLFWLLLGFSSLSYFLSQVFWNFEEWVLGIEQSQLSFSDFFWGLEILLFFIAIAIKMTQLNNHRETMKMMFDILIVMTVATTLSWQYLLEPDLIEYQIDDWLGALTFLFTPVADLGLLFGVLAINYSSQRAKRNSLSIFFTLGIIVLLIADSHYMYQGYNGIYTTGGLYDPLWSLSLLLIGLSSMYSSKTLETSLQISILEQNDLIKLRKPIREYFFMVLPYLAVFLLFILELRKIHFDSVLFGLTISIVLIIFRQIFTLLENEKIMNTYKALTERMDEKIKDRTEELEFLANHDQLTGLPNRRYFESYLNDSIKLAREQDGKLAVFLLDLDRFKQINDVMGHATGDALLISMAERLVSCVNFSGKVFRLGGDEFIIIMKDTPREAIWKKAAEINWAISQPLLLQEEELIISTSIGISLYPDYGNDVVSLMKNADAAMYQAKEKGRDNFEFYNEEINNMLSKRMTIEQGLAEALKDESLFLVYQPLVNTQKQEIFGAEALLRWKHETLGHIPPSEFIPVAEETGKIFELGFWVMEKACSQAKLWHEQGYALKISLNISVAQLKDRRFVDCTTEILRKTGINPGLILFEITESVAILDGEFVINKLNQIKALGISIAIDDFGTGYSSLSYINKFPISELKIDKSFIDNIDRSEQDKQIVSTIIALANTLKTNVIAEGVETLSQVETLQSLGSYQAQGYLFSKPLGAKEFERMMSHSAIRKLPHKQ